MITHDAFIKEPLEEPEKKVVSFTSLVDYYWVAGYSKIGCAWRKLELSRGDHLLWGSTRKMAHPSKRDEAIKDMELFAAILSRWRQQQHDYEKNASEGEFLSRVDVKIAIEMGRRQEIFFCQEVANAIDMVRYYYCLALRQLKYKRGHHQTAKHSPLAVIHGNPCLACEEWDVVKHDLKELAEYDRENGVIRKPWSADALVDLVDRFNTFQIASLHNLQKVKVPDPEATVKEMINQVLYFFPCICVELRVCTTGCIAAKNVYFLSIPDLGGRAQHYLWSLLVLGFEGWHTDPLDSAKMGDDDNMMECPAQAQVDVNAKMKSPGNNTKQKIKNKKEQQIQRCGCR